MATTTLRAIIERWQTVLEATTIGLVRAADAFTHDLQPNSVVDDSYYIEDGGPVNRSSLGNSAEVRIDRLTIWIAKPRAFAADTQFKAMEDLAVTIYRALVADAISQGWNLEEDGRRVTAPAASELMIGSFSFRVDYDFSSAVS